MIENLPLSPTFLFLLATIILFSDSNKNENCKIYDNVLKIISQFDSKKSF